MKKEKKMPPVSKGKKTGPGSDPVNKFKKGKSTTAAQIDNKITGAVENVKSRSVKRRSSDGTIPFYGEES